MSFHRRNILINIDDNKNDKSNNDKIILNMYIDKIAIKTLP